jgi:uncharacterized protein YnzC (UPF0291/DUF896 family)
VENKILVDRLNELYRESQLRTLSPEELQERDQLRREYLAMIKDQIRNSLDRIEIKMNRGI